MGYIFDPEHLHEVAKRGVGLPHDEMVHLVTGELAKAYPGHIETRQDWTFSVVAGSTGIMTLLHASLSEYVLLFGTPVGTEGLSGRYSMDVYDYQLAGDIWSYSDNDHACRVVTRPGEKTLLRRGHVRGYKLPEGGWMLEYARGIIPMALPIALGGMIFSCMDATTLVKTLKTYTRLVTRELLQGKI
jgi:C-8 sterol isomerase